MRLSGTVAKRAVTADPTLRRVAPRVWLGGSPLKMFRVSDKGADLLEEFGRCGVWTPADAAEMLLCERLLDAGAVHPRIPEGSRSGGDGTAQHGPTAADVTAVIPVRDDTHGLRTLLAGLSGARGTCIRTVVVDDGSRDPGAVAAVAATHGSTVVRHDTSRGPAAARNSGLRLVETPLVAFLDADVSTSVGWLAPLLAHLGDEGVVAVAPRVRTAGGSGLLASYERQHSPLDMGPVPARVRPGTRVAYVPTAALLVRVAELRSVGGFDETLRFGEDVDLIWRLGESGGTVRYEPSAVVEHAPRPDLRGWLRQRYGYGTSATELDRRHPGSVAPVAISPWSAAAWCGVAADHPVAGVAIAGSSAALLARRLANVPADTALRLAIRGHLDAGRQLATAVLRPWWPIALTASLLSRRARRVVVAAVFVKAATDRGRPSHRAIALLDDLAYSLGVCSAVLRERRVGALLPRFLRWP